MLLKTPVEDVFIQLTDSVKRLTPEEYTKPGKTIFGATVGQHVRHIIELFLCLGAGYEEGAVNYEKRKRDYRIETDQEFACYLLRKIFREIDRPNKKLSLEAEDYDDSLDTASIPTNYYREIAYNLEHTIHHMALIRIGITEVSDIALPEGFGVAYSTMKYRMQCAQ